MKLTSSQLPPSLLLSASSPLLPPFLLPLSPSLPPSLHSPSFHPSCASSLSLHASSPPRSTLLQDVQSKPTTSTCHYSLGNQFSPSLDKLLDGGLMTGEVTELTGAPATGKTQVSLSVSHTYLHRLLSFFLLPILVSSSVSHSPSLSLHSHQLCHSLAAAAVLDTNSTVLWVDSTGGFSPTRLQQNMLKGGVKEEVHTYKYMYVYMYMYVMYHYGNWLFLFFCYHLLMATDLGLYILTPGHSRSTGTDSSTPYL